MVAPLLPAIATSVHATIGATGLIVSAYALPYGFFQIAYGPLADRFGKVAVVRVAVLAFGAGTLGCGFTADLTSLTVLRVLTGGFAASVFPMTLAYIGDVIPMARRQQAIGNLVTVTSIGIALSPAIGGIVADALSWQDLFIACGVLTFPPALLLFLLPQPRGEATGARGLVTLLKPYRDVLGNRAAQTIDALVCLEGALTAGITYLGAFLHDEYHLEYSRVGLLLALYGVGMLTTSRFIGRLGARFGSARLVFLGASMLATSYLVLLGPHVQALFAVAMVIMGLGFVLCHSTLQYRITEAVPSLRGTAVALFAFSLFLGGGAGTAILSALVTFSGYGAVQLFCGVGLAVFAVVGSLAIDRLPKPEGVRK
jgi:predicted MFS family arabinose efflux permease